jgi:hypothetical protein
VTADLREAFHIACVEFVGWRRVNEQQRLMGWQNVETMQREYLPEPTVEFFGRSFLISQICSHATVLNGPLPLHIQALFVVIDDGMGAPIPETYPEAVEVLEVVITCEHDSQAAAPLTKPPLVEQLRARSFAEGASAVNGAFWIDAEA